MKYAIFSLLAFCALITVFAGLSLEDTLSKLRNDSYKQLFAVEEGLKFAFKARVEDAKERAILLNSKLKYNCMRPYRKFNKEYFEPSVMSCFECHNEAGTARDIQMATQCCHDIHAELERRAEQTHDAVIACLDSLINQAALKLSGRQAGSSSSLDHINEHLKELHLRE